MRCVNASLLYSMDLHWSWPGGGDGNSSGSGDDGGGSSSSSRVPAGGGGGGNVCLWVAAGTVFLDVLTWSFPSLTAAMLRSSAASGVCCPTLPSLGRLYLFCLVHSWGLHSAYLSASASAATRFTNHLVTLVTRPTLRLAHSTGPQPARTAPAAPTGEEQSDQAPAAAVAQPPAITRPVHQKLLGHTGSIHR